MKVRYLLVLAFFFTITALIGLRLNQNGVAKLKREVIAADKENKNLNAALKSLQDYVSSHMNTSTKVELVNSYERAVAEAQATADTEEDGRLLGEAQAACDKPGVSSVAQAQCVREYLETHRRPGSNPEPLRLPEKSRFIHAFVSPLWTPDLAGIGLLLALIFSIAALAVYTKHVISNASKNRLN